MVSAGTVILQSNSSRAIVFGTGAKSSVVISLTNLTGAQAPPERFFCARFMVGCVGALSGASFPVSDKANPARLITSGLASGSDEIETSWFRIISAIGNLRASWYSSGSSRLRDEARMNYNQLTENERYQIYALKKAGLLQNEIAKQLNRDPATISREINRNTGLRGYRPKQAQRLSDERRKTAHKARKVSGEIQGKIKALIRKDLSPQQVVGYLEKQEGISLHHETVYQLVYADKRDGGDLYTHLRIISKPYRKRYGSYDRRGKIKNRVSIENRPSLVERRNRIGDWEGDTIIGKGRKGALLTLVERKTLYTVIRRLTGKRADLLAEEAVAAMQEMRDKVKTITFDNGLEFSAHEHIAEKLDVKIYFAHPYASWERGINENTNGLIRQYFPKDTDFSMVTDEDIQFVMNRLNERPRATRNFRSPNEMFLGQRVDLLAA